MAFTKGYQVLPELTLGVLIDANEHQKVIKKERGVYSSLALPLSLSLSLSLSLALSLSLCAPVPASVSLSLHLSLSVPCLLRQLCTATPTQMSKLH